MHDRVRASGDGMAAGWIAVHYDALCRKFWERATATKLPDWQLEKAVSLIDDDMLKQAMFASKEKVRLFIRVV